VTGIDTVERALSRAHERAAQAGVVIELKQADVTALHEAGIGSGFDLLLDTGTFHGLRDEQRTEMGSAVTAVAAPGATLILDCFAPRRRGPLPRGAGRADVQAAFPEWDLVDERAADFCPDRLARMMRFEERFYRLRRR
jgi:hypothetical protein